MYIIVRNFDGTVFCEHKKMYSFELFSAEMFNNDNKARPKVFHSITAANSFIDNTYLFKYSEQDFSISSIILKPEID